MRETMRKEITSTKITAMKVVVDEKGKHNIADMQDIEVIGNLSTGSKALDHVKETLGKEYTVYSTEVTTQVYVANVIDFFKIAKPLETEKPESESEQTESN